MNKFIFLFFFWFTLGCTINRAQVDKDIDLLNAVEDQLQRPITEPVVPKPVSNAPIVNYVPK